MANQETSAVWICDSCVHGPPSSFGGKPCAVCNPNYQMLSYYQKREEPVITNADRIRAMSDEELAEWLQGMKYSPTCDSKCHDDYEKYGEQRTYCTDCWLDWLQSPAGEVEDGD